MARESGIRITWSPPVAVAEICWNALAASAITMALGEFRGGNAGSGTNSMHVNVRCPRCGKPLDASADMIGKQVLCAFCQREFELIDPTATAELVIPRPGLPRDDTLSRSMLPVRAATAAPPDEMLGRLEPRTLRWLNATEAVEEFLAQRLDQLKKRRFTEFLHPDDRALAEDEFRKAVEMGERHDFVLRLPHPSGAMRYVRVYTQARYNPDGAINHIRCYLKDVTERVRAEEELRRRTEQLTAANEQLRKINEKLKEAQSQLVHSEKLAALGTLAAGMAHEINNPLAFTMNNVAVLGRDIGDLLKIVACYEEGLEDLRLSRPELAAKITHLQDEADLPYLRTNLPRMTDSARQGLARVAKIVENLRGFAQLDRSELAVIDVNQSLDHSIGMLADSLAQHRVEVVREYRPLPPLECAGAHLNQLFLNILMNALQAIATTDRGSGRIRVATKPAVDEIVVKIADDGCGIPPEALPRIFDPFFTTKPVGSGTGLGLSIGHGIIADQGGRIEVESVVGQGTKFTIHLPTQRPARLPAR